MSEFLDRAKQSASNVAEQVKQAFTGEPSTAQTSSTTVSSPSGISTPQTTTTSTTGGGLTGDSRSVGEQIHAGVDSLKEKGHEALHRGQESGYSAQNRGSETLEQISDKVREKTGQM